MKPYTSMPTNVVGIEVYGFKLYILFLYKQLQLQIDTYNLKLYCIDYSN